MPPAGHAREVEPGGPGNTPFGPQAHSSKQPDAIHRRFQASMRVS